MIFGSAVFVNTSLGTDADYLSWWCAKTEQLKAELKQVFQKALDSLSLSVGYDVFEPSACRILWFSLPTCGLSCEFITVMSVCVKSLCHTESTFYFSPFWENRSRKWCVGLHVGSQIRANAAWMCSSGLMTRVISSRLQLWHTLQFLILVHVMSVH